MLPSGVDLAVLKDSASKMCKTCTACVIVFVAEFSLLLMYIFYFYFSK